MSKPSNSLLKAGWKWPLLNEQLTELNQQLLSCVESIVEPKRLLKITEGYQQVYSKFIAINLIDFANLTELIIVSLVNTVKIDKTAEPKLKTDSLLAIVEVSSILQRQFQSFFDRGSYDPESIAEATQQLQSLFGLMGFEPKAANNGGANNLQQGDTPLVESTYDKDSDRVVISLSQRMASVTDPIQPSSLSKSEGPEPIATEHQKQTSTSQLETTAALKAVIEPETVKQQPTKPEQVKVVEPREAKSDSTSSWALLQSARQQVQLAADDKQCDEEIKTIFIEEANEVLQTVSSQFSKLTFLQDNPQLLSEIRRGFHTLKGSGRMAGAHATADLAAVIEAMLNRILEGTLSASYGMQQLLGEVIEHYPSLIRRFKQQADYPDSIKLWIAAAQLYANHKASGFEYPGLVQDSLAPHEKVGYQASQQQAGAIQPPQQDEQCLLQPEIASELQAQSEAEELKQLFITEAKELIASIEDILQQFSTQERAVVSDDLIRAFHTLRGAASSQSSSEISEISAKIEYSLQRLQQQGEQLSASQLQVMSQAIQLIKNYLQGYDEGAVSAQSQAEIARLKAVLASTIDQKMSPNDAPVSNSLHDEGVEPESHDDNDYRVAELIEGIDELLDAEWELDRLFNFDEQLSAQQQAEVVEYATKLKAQCQFLAAKVTRSEPFSTLLSSLHQAYQTVAQNPRLLKDSDNVDTLIAGHEQLTGLFDSLAGKMALRLDKRVLQQLAKFTAIIDHNEANLANSDDQKTENEDSHLQSSSIKSSSNNGSDDGKVDVNQGLQPVQSTADSSPSEWLVEEIDTEAELLAIFTEEAQELDAGCHKQLMLWQQQPTNIEPIKVLQRHLHTLKGGALMAGIDSITELSHEAETLYQYFTVKQIEPTADWVAIMQSVQDVLSDQIECLRTKQQSFYAPEMLRQLRHLAQTKSLTENKIKPKFAVPEFESDSQSNPESDFKLEDEPNLKSSFELKDDLKPETVDNHQSWQQAGIELQDITEMPSWLGEAQQTEESTPTAEMIRVPTKLMEQMIDLSGESVINRSRIELSMNSVGQNLEEMERTVQRLSEQLRRMDIELEAQIRSQIEDKNTQHSHSFDPLEMDQYSALNQLSKSLAESASDLLQIKTTLKNKTQGTESLLTQLSQAQTQLQQGLMTSRMVSFSRIIPRLQRTVRQTASELDKSVALEVIAEHDEIDRTVLERLTAPLEHMLRNSVDHGVESPEQRELLDKPRQGKIVIEIAREGSEIVIRIEDDGRGIDIESVRHKAISQGLIAANDSSVSDLEVMQYIFHAGLSTASRVTQISGRGVGMDVVRNEVRQLGGSVNVNSEPGQGSQFVLKLPLTIAVAEVLMVRAADQIFAIPLLQIERVERVESQQLLNFYYSGSSYPDNSQSSLNKDEGEATVNNEDFFSLADSKYRLKHLDSLLGGRVPSPKSLQNTSSCPVLLLKNQVGQNFALQVDEIIGSRTEVVVKPLAGLLSSIPGLSAATLTAEGSVIFILDTLALMHENIMRHSIATQSVAIQAIKDSSNQAIYDPVQPKPNAKAQILIVDDSVTVRKVTSRMMQRHGYETHVARDGVEALQILQTLTPDLMLLDIEMPRMDGFEVANHVRHNPKIKNTPIIMITSRTGEKHRQKALQIGVNDYLGKPFQEAVLIHSIQALLGKD